MDFEIIDKETREVIGHADTGFISLEEAKNIFKESIDEAETPIDLYRIILEKIYEKGVEDGRSEQH